uniref:Uncharacterized protein n=1 Tax=Oryza brachyantha TaxID=4533 RepID=J3LAG9_ORYBR
MKVNRGCSSGAEVRKRLPVSTLAGTCASPNYKVYTVVLNGSRSLFSRLPRTVVADMWTRGSRLQRIRFRPKPPTVLL